MKKVISLVLALVMIMALATTAFAAQITVNVPDYPDGYDTTQEITYNIYKVFDATKDGDNISYKLVDGKTTAPDGFTADDNGYVTYDTEDVSDLTADDIAAIKAYVENNTPVASVTVAVADGVAVFKNLDLGYYYIDTTSGTVVTINTAGDDAVVNDKNGVPTLTKIISDAENFVNADGNKAIAQLGTDVEYTLTIEVKEGARNYVFHDQMDEGLTYNDDIAVTVDGKDVDAGEDTYTVGAEGDDTITVTFDDDYISTLVGKSIVLTYTGKLTDDALTTEPLLNTAYLDFGDSSKVISTPEVTTKTYSAQIGLYKFNDQTNSALAGAGFVLRNSEDKYYKLDDGVVTWVDSADDADERTSAANGYIDPFVGLTTGTYYLEEVAVPAGFAEVQDAEIEIVGDDYTAENLEQVANVPNTPGELLPTTGGIGTTIFYVLGTVLVLGAAVLLITKRRMIVE